MLIYTLNNSLGLQASFIFFTSGKLKTITFLKIKAILRQDCVAVDFNVVDESSKWKPTALLIHKDMSSQNTKAEIKFVDSLALPFSIWISDAAPSIKDPKAISPQVPLRYQDVANRDKRFLWKITYSYGQLPLGRTLQHAWGIKLYKLDWIESALLMAQKINQSGWKIFLKWLTGSSCGSQGYLIFVEPLKCPKLRGCWREIQTTPFAISIWTFVIVSSLPKAVSQWEPIVPLPTSKTSLKSE